MATTGKKEYTLKINGIDASIKDITRLEKIVMSLDASFGKVSNTAIKVTSTVKERTKALSEEEKAEQKLIHTIDKVVQARSDASKAQIEANIAAREAQREVTREIQIRQQAEGSIKQMGMQLTDLRNKYEGLSKAEREDIAVGGELLQQIQALDTEYKALRESTGNFRDSVGNYEKALSGLGKVSDGIEGITKSSMGMAQALMGGVSLMALFGNESEESAESALRLQKVIALLSIAQQVNENILRSGIVQNKLAIVTDTIRTVQIKAKTAAEIASTKGTLAATVAQKAFNAVASANPYVLLATALIAVGSALFAFASGSRKAKEEQAKLNEEIEVSRRMLSRYADDLEQEARIAEAAGKSALEVQDLRIAGAEKLLKRQQDLLESMNADTRVSKERFDEQLALVKEADEKLESLRKERRVLEVKDNTERAEAAKDAAKERAKAEKDAVRDAVDARVALIKNADERALKQTQLTYGRQIEALRERLATETNLTEKAKAAINDRIESLEKQGERALEDLRKEQAERDLALRQEVEDSRLSIMQDGFEKQYAEINTQYDRQIEAYEKRLEEYKKKTGETSEEISELIYNAQIARGNALSELLAEQSRQRADQTLAEAEKIAEKARELSDRAIERKENGWQLIDVEATRENLSAANDAWAGYIQELTEYKEKETAAHRAALADLQQGTPKYEAEVRRYAEAMEEASRRIIDAQGEIADNTESSNNLIIDYLGDLFGKIAEAADIAAQAIYAVTDTLNMGLQAQLDSLNEQIEALDERYKEAQEKREQAADNVEEIEEKMRNATGGTAEALKSQLQEATHAREEAAREEKRIAKEKERLEAQAEKKEKQMRRNDLISRIAAATADVAAAVAKALTAGPFIGQIQAGIYAAIGAVQIGIMTKQLTKLADGGEIIGPSHANGGVPIAGTNYEVEGGEFVVNKRSYGANANLIKFINDTPRTITAADLLGVVPGDDAPAVVADAGQSSEDRIVEAINGINFRPVVSVTDINDVNDEMVTVKELAGF